MTQRLLLFLLINTTAFIHTAQQSLQEPKIRTTQLHRAALDNDLAKASTLLNRQPPANPDRRMNHPQQPTPLCIASSKNSLAMVQLLLNHGANPNIADKNGMYPLDIAFRNNFIPLIILFAEHSDPNIPFQNGMSLFTLALKKTKEDSLWLLEALVKNPNFNVENHIDQATNAGYPKAAAFLRNHSAQKQQPDRTTMLAQLEKRQNTEKEPTAKRQHLEQCFCCQDDICSENNPGAQVFNCNHSVHKNCLQELTAHGYNQCQLCQAVLKTQSQTNISYQKTAAQQAQEEHDAMIASLLAAGILTDEDLAHI